MTILGAVLVAIGIVAGGWGVWAAFERPRPWMGAIVAPVGIAAALLGALLIFVPGFFG
jgi:hypothetical protein